MPGRVDIKVDTGEVVRLIKAAQSRMRHVDMGVVAEEMLTAVDDLFQAQGAVGGSPEWDPLKESTLRRHPRRRGKPVLQATGRMANFQPRSGPLFAEVKSPAKFAGFHVTGTRHMARRDPTAIDFDTTLEKIGARVLEDLVRF